MVWGALLFHETITPQKIIGAVIIVARIVLFAFSGTEKEENGDA